MFEKGVDVLVGQIGDLPDVGGGGRGEKFGGGIAFAKGEDPAVAMSLTSSASSGKVNASRWWN